MQEDNSTVTADNVELKDMSVQEGKIDTDTQAKRKKVVSSSNNRIVSRGSLNVVMSGSSEGKSGESRGDGDSKSHAAKGFMHEMVHTHTKADLREAFDAVDLDKSGDVTFEEYLSICGSLGVSTTREVLQKRFNELDRDHDGTMSFDEFTVAFKKTRDEYLLIARLTAVTVFGTVILFWYGIYDILGGLVYDKLVEHYNPEEDTYVEGKVSLCLGLSYLAIVCLILWKMKALVSATDTGDGDQVTALIDEEVNLEAGCCNAEKSKVCGHSCLFKLVPINKLLCCDKKAYSMDVMLWGILNFMASMGVTLWLGFDLTFGGFDMMINPEELDSVRVWYCVGCVVVANAILISLGQMNNQFGLWSVLEGKTVVFDANEKNYAAAAADDDDEDSKKDSTAAEKTDGDNSAV